MVLYFFTVYFLVNTVTLKSNIYLCVQGDGELPSLTAAAQLMHSAALQGFCLLLSLTDRSDMVARAPALLEQMMALLETPNLEMRYSWPHI